MKPLAFSLLTSYVCKTPPTLSVLRVRYPPPASISSWLTPFAHIMNHCTPVRHLSSSLLQRALSKSRLRPSSCRSFCLWKAVSFGAQTLQLTLSPCPPPSTLPSFYLSSFAISLTLLFHLDSPRDNRFLDPSIEFSHLCCLPFSGSLSSYHHWSFVLASLFRRMR